MIRILTIGNSFADNATTFLTQIAAAGGHEIIVGKANLGGCSLEKHWNLVEQCRALPEVKPYEMYLSGRDERPAMNLVEILRAQTWDYVTLQQASSYSWRYESYNPFFGNLLALVRDHAPQATLLIHQTWAYRVDAPYFKEFGISQPVMFERLRENYDAISRKFGLRILPSGTAFENARKKLNFKPDNNFDYENPPLMALPDQARSIIRGHHWRTGNTGSGKAELGADWIHGNDKGCYLGGAVWYQMLTGGDIMTNSFVPEGVKAEFMPLLKEAAREAVEEYGGPLIGR